MSTYNTFSTLILSVEMPNISANTYEQAENEALRRFSQLAQTLTDLSSESFPHMRITVNHVDEIDIMENVPARTYAISSGYTSMASLINSRVSEQQPTVTPPSNGYTRLTN
jgi:hypothetical protein